MPELLTQIPASTVALVVALVLVLLQEGVNGFHDTASAIAAAVYSNSIEARYAVLMAATLNFAGVMVSGCAVAFAMVYLLPVEMVAGIGTTSEVAFLLAMVVTAVLWNLTTWFLGIPNSTTHTYVGAILGVTAAHAFVHGQSISAHMHWHEGEKVIAAHGTATQLAAIACIALADGSAVPVSTTHVVTSGVAGSMRASGAGLQLSTIRGILITWFTTMPGCFALSFAFSIVLHAAFA